MRIDQKIPYPILTLILGLFTVPSALQAQPQDTLSLDQASQEARKNSPQILSSEAKADASDWAETGAFSGFLPMVNFTASHYFDLKYQTLNVKLGPEASVFPLVTPATTYDFQARWSVFNGFEDHYRFSGAKALKLAAHRELDYTRFQIEQAVQIAYFQAIAARELQAVSEENVRNLSAHLQQVEDMMNVGQALRVDVLRVQVQLSNAKSESLNARDQVIIAQSKLAQLMGKKSDGRQPTGNLPLPDESIAARIEAEKLGTDKRASDQSRGDLEGLSLRAQAAESEGAARRNYFIPKVALVGDYLFYNNIDRGVTSSDSFKSAYQYGVQVSWNLFDGFLSHARAEEALAEARQAVHADTEARLQAATDFETYRSDYRYQLTQYQTQTENLARSKQSVELALAGLKRGTQTNTDVLDAELDLFNARAGVIKAQISALQAQINFENTIGRKL